MPRPSFEQLRFGKPAPRRAHRCRTHPRRTRPRITSQIWTQPRWYRNQCRAHATCLNAVHHKVRIAFPLPEVCRLQIVRRQLEGKLLTRSGDNSSHELNVVLSCLLQLGNDLCIYRFLCINEELAKGRIARLPRGLKLCRHSRGDS